jgi:hypothetical protein
LVFYLGIPGTVGFLLGLNHAGMAQHFPVLIGIPYWVGANVVIWLALDMCSRATAAVLRPWAPPLWLTLLLGALVALIICYPFVTWHSGLYARFLPPGVSYTVVPPLPSVLGKIETVLAYSGTPLFWIAINYYYDRILDIPRYRGSALEIVVPAKAESRKDTAPAAPPTVELPFARLVPAAIGAEVIALRAEDHYIRVYTRKGNALIRYRFGDAARELAHLDGLQVHRSAWVLRSAVLQGRPSSDGWVLDLGNGIEIPVSRAYHKVVQHAGLVG